MPNTFVALVTGTDKGIGLEIATDPAAHGFAVLVGSRDLAHGQAAAAGVGAAARPCATPRTRHPSPRRAGVGGAHVQAHDRDKHGFATYLLPVARKKGVSAYVGDGRNRWPAVHRLDAAPLYRLALEQGVAGARYHAVAEEGVPVREIAEAIGRGLNMPVVGLSPENAAGHFGWLARVVGMDTPTSGALVEEFGPAITAGITAEAAQADLVVLGVRWRDLPGALAGLPDWNGRIVVDATNPIAAVDPDAPAAADPGNPLAAYGLTVVDTGGRLSSEVVYDLVPGARLVRAFNHLPVELLPHPRALGGQRVLFYRGDDAAAKAEVRTLSEHLGMYPVDLGPLHVGGALAAVPFGPLAGAEFLKAADPDAGPPAPALNA